MKLQLCLTISPELFEWTKQKCEEEQRSAANFVTKMLRDRMLQEQAQANQE